MPKKKTRPFVPPGNETDEAREIREAVERELAATLRAKDEKIAELQLHVRRLKSDLVHSGRVLARTGGLLHEFELERQEREAREAREARGRRRRRAS